MFCIIQLGHLFGRLTVCDPSPYFYKGVSVPCEHYLGYDRFEHATNFNSAPGSTYQFALASDRSLGISAETGTENLVFFIIRFRPNIRFLMLTET